MTTLRIPTLSFLIAALALTAAPAAAQSKPQLNIPVLVPITGFLSLEGTSQRNGAVLALEQAKDGLAIRYRVADTATSPEVAVNALLKALRHGDASAVVASMLGTQMLAMLPIAKQYKVPLITVSGTAKITELGNPYVFRFFPGDAVVKVAQSRYVVEDLGLKRPALIYQTTAYGQSGRAHLARMFAKLGAELVFEDGISPAVKDMLPILAKARAAKPDVLVIHLHSGPTALLIRQARAMGMTLPIVAGSAMHQPSTAALLKPGELKDVCAESGSSPVSGDSPGIKAFTAAYQKAHGRAPDAFALGQYDGVMMVLDAAAKGATTPEKLRAALAQNSYRGLAMTYKSDGKGNMAHDAIILCYDGKSRVPRVVKRYRNVTGAR